MSLTIVPVEKKHDLGLFIDLGWEINSDAPLWAPPLKFDFRKQLDRQKNPFFQHAQAEYFIALRDGKPVGRLTAHIDRNFNEIHENHWGMFGFFECEDNVETAKALLGEAKKWLSERGCDRIVGPMSFTTNHDNLGVLIDGFEKAPSILTQWTQPYYPKLLEATGLTKAMDLYMWRLEIADRSKVHPAIWDAAEKVESEHGIVVRPMRKNDLEAEVERFLSVYNAAWEKNWGFVPLDDAEVRHMAKELKPILDKNWAFIAEKDGETVGAALSLPDYNQVLYKMNGKLFPLGLAKALWYRRKIDRVRVFALGVKPDYHHTGVAAKMYQLHFDSAARTPQTWGETGWILEINTAMNRAMEGMGGEITRRYRIFEQDL